MNGSNGLAAVLYCIIHALCIEPFTIAGMMYSPVEFAITYDQKDVSLYSILKIAFE